MKWEWGTLIAPWNGVSLFVNEAFREALLNPMSERLRQAIQSMNCVQPIAGGGIETIWPGRRQRKNATPKMLVGANESNLEIPGSRNVAFTQKTRFLKHKFWIFPADLKVMAARLRELIGSASV